VKLDYKNLFRNLIVRLKNPYFNTWSKNLKEYTTENLKFI
jgi:hypothetical protein